MKGKIYKSLSGFYYVRSEDDGKIYQTRARGNFRKFKIKPVVGDIVNFESTNLRDGYLLEVFPRKNELQRPPVANIELGIIVVSAVRPNFSANLLDRFLIMLAAKKIRPLIFLTKLDLLNESEFSDLQKILKVYQEIGYSVIFQSVQQKAVDEIKQYLAKKISVVMGQTGAGKSTLLNKIAPQLDLRTGEISDSLGRGKHTTRSVELLEIAGGLVADTPGFSLFEFSDLTSADLPKMFPEFVRLSGNCRFRECRHKNEPDCAVKEALEQGKISADRYEHYLYFLNELEENR